MLPPFHEPRWPDRLVALCRELTADRADPDDPGCPASAGSGGREACKSALWLLLHEALTRYMDRQMARLGRVDRADLEDLAAGKALELLLNAESGKWDVQGRNGAEIAAFLSTVARNALIDRQRRRRREVSVGDVEAGLRHDPGEPSLDASPHDAVHGAEALDRVLAERFAVDLKLCASRLAPRSRWAWFLRVFHEMPTRAIAAHPAVDLKPGHVDVLLQRCRKAIRDCMEQRGHDTDQLPPGTFVALWTALRGEEGGTDGAPRPQDGRGPFEGLGTAPAGVMDEPF